METQYISKFKDFAADAEKKLERAASMGAVQRFNREVKQQQLQLTTACRAAIESLHAVLNDSQQQLEIVQSQYVASCITFDEGNPKNARCHISKNTSCLVQYFFCLF